MSSSTEERKIRVAGHTLTKEEQREMLRSILPAAPPQEGTPQNTFTESEIEELRQAIPSLEIVQRSEESQHVRRNTIEDMVFWEPPAAFDIAPPQDGYDYETDKEQHVWLIRYGKTSPGLIENVGNYDSDLHQEGVEHAEAIAQHIAASGTLPEHVFSDPFLRCMHTADTIAESLNNISNKNLKVKVEEGMTEWQVPSLLVDPAGIRTNPRSVDQLMQIFDNIDGSYISLNPQGPDRDCPEDAQEGCPRFPETEEELHQRCKASIEMMLDYVGDESMAIVSHAPCLQYTALALEGSASPKESKLGAWSLGGVTHFSRKVGETKWTLQAYSGTSHMPGEYKKGELGKWSLPTFARA